MRTMRRTPSALQASSLCESAGAAGNDDVSCGENRRDSAAGGNEALAIAQVAECKLDAVGREFSW